MAEDTLLELEHLKTWFPVRTGIRGSLFSRKRNYVRAVDDISFRIRREEFFCLVGESGCGKTTTAKTVLRLLNPTSGRIVFDSEDITFLDGKQLRQIRHKIQLIFQDPYESLNPRYTVFNTIAEGLIVNRLVNARQEIMERVSEALSGVGLEPPEDFFNRYPHELSGGQRQRVAIAGALALKPKLIVADEPVSMLDASIRAGILKLMFELKEKFGLTYLLITHDLSLAYTVSDRIAVMYVGKIVETGPTETVIRNPQHPYTKALISVVPRPDPKAVRRKLMLPGDPPDPINIPSGCRFRTRCSYAQGICEHTEPELEEKEGKHAVACHFAWKLLETD